MVGLCRRSSILAAPKASALHAFAIRMQAGKDPRKECAMAHKETYTSSLQRRNNYIANLFHLATNTEYMRLAAMLRIKNRIANAMWTFAGVAAFITIAAYIINNIK